jgi:hypothetical protein
MDEEKPEPKISLPEAIFVGSLIVLADTVEFILLFFGLDDFWISDAIAFPSTQIYLRMKGVRGTYSLVANLLELIPYLGDLPFRTIGFVLVVWFDHHPKVEAVVKKAAAVAVAVAATAATGGATAPAAGAVAAGGGAAAGGAAAAGAGAAAAEGAAAAGVVGAGGAAAGAGEAAVGAEAAAARAAGGIREEAGGAAVKEAAAAGKEIPPEALGEEESVFKKLKRPLEQLPEPEEKEERGGQKETIEIDEENNQIDLRKAA